MPDEAIVQSAPPDGSPAGPSKPAKKNPAAEFLASRVRPVFERAVQFINTRNPREKIMITALLVTAVIGLDLAIFVFPLVRVFSATLPEAAVLEDKLSSLKADWQNRTLIEKDWVQTRDRLAERERAFIKSNELPALLENLNGLALNSGVRIISLKPVEIPERGQASRYRSTPIKISAMAGTHELGKFLSQLETGVTFFRVTNLVISANNTDIRRHKVDLDLEAYSQTGTKTV